MYTGLKSLLPGNNSVSSVRFLCKVSVSVPCVEYLALFWKLIQLQPRIKVDIFSFKKQFPRCFSPHNNDIETRDLLIAHIPFLYRLFWGLQDHKWKQMDGAVIHNGRLTLMKTRGKKRNSSAQFLFVRSVEIRTSFLTVRKIQCFYIAHVVSL